MSNGFRLGLALGAVAMVLLPAVYVLFVIGTAVGVYYYATNCYGLLADGLPGFLLYLTPISAGTVGVAFMIKPLFSRPPSLEAYLEINRETQPALFEFIEEICTRMGAPRPVAVRLDTQANASAGFQHGWRGVLSRKLVLTIGLPLVQEMTVSQFGGVLAHEFGHFTQATAMRFSYVVRVINGWFRRVIFERDSFDAKLAAARRRRNLYALSIANGIHAFVWLARQILTLLMRLGHAASAYLMRQMEYDSDHYEQEVAGAANFRETFFRLRLLNAGLQMTGPHVNKLWADRKLVDNLPLLTQRLVASIPEEAVNQIRANINADRSRSKWYSTHPSDFERMAQAARLPDEGALLGDEPATTLFADWDHLAATLTLIDYSKRFKLSFKPEALVSTDSYLADNSAHAERIKKMAHFFGGALHQQRLLFPDPLEDSAPALEVLHARFQACSRALEDLRPATEKLSVEIEAARARRANAMAAETILKMGLRVNVARFGLKSAKRAAIPVAIAEASQEIDQKMERLGPALALAREKLSLYAQLPASPEWVARVGADTAWADWLARIALVTRTLVALRPIYDELKARRKSFFLATVCVQNFKAAKNKKWTNQQFEAYATEFRSTIGRIELVTDAMPYPLLDGKSYHNLTSYFHTGNDKTGSAGQYGYLRSMYDRSLHLYSELMLELVEKIAPIEAACGQSDDVSASGSASGQH